MPTNPNVLKDRNKYVGGSEISTILGINKFNTRWNLLRLKAGYIDDDFEGNEYTRYGDTMEPKIRDYINTLNYSKTKFIEDTIAIEEPIIGRRCNYDGKSKTHGLEIKTTSQIHNDVRDYKYYVVQLLWGMVLGGLKKGILAVYHRPDDFNEEFDENRLQIFEINIKDFKDWTEEIEEAVSQFKRDLEKILENPFLSEADLLPAELVNASLQLEKFEEREIERKKEDEEYKKFKSNLLMLMKNYGCKTWITPNKKIKITAVEESPDKEVEITSYDEDSFIHENPELHEAYHNKLAEYKIIRKEIKKGKSAYLKITLPNN